MAGLSDNMEALKRNFLFRGFFNRRGYFNLADISPEEYRKGALTKDGDRQALRVWLRDDVLFIPTASGSDEQLTDEGKARLDSALAPNLQRLADSILIVEGYSLEGSRANQYVVSQTRATLVRDRSEEHTSELQSQSNLVCRLLLEKKKKEKQQKKC